MSSISQYNVSQGHSHSGFYCNVDIMSIYFGIHDTHSVYKYIEKVKRSVALSIFFTSETYCGAIPIPGAIVTDIMSIYSGI